MSAAPQAVRGCVPRIRVNSRDNSLQYLYIALTDLLPANSEWQWPADAGVPVRAVADSGPAPGLVGPGSARKDWPGQSAPVLHQGWSPGRVPTRSRRRLGSQLFA